MATVPKDINATKAGFSLIELIVVMVIMGIFLVYTVPKIESGTKINIDRSVRSLAGTIAFVRNETIFKKKNLRIVYYIEENTFSIKEIKMTEEGLEQTDYIKDKVFELDDGVSFMDVTTAYGDKTTYGKAYTHFFTSGMVEKTLIHLQNENEVEKTLEVSVLTGEVVTYDEYYEEDTF